MLLGWAGLGVKGGVGMGPLACGKDGLSGTAGESDYEAGRKAVLLCIEVGDGDKKEENMANRFDSISKSTKEEQAMKARRKVAVALAVLVALTAGCTTTLTRENSAGVADKIATFVLQGKYREARDMAMKVSPQDLRKSLVSLVTLVEQNQFQEAREMAVEACPEEIREQCAELVMRNRIQQARALLQKRQAALVAQANPQEQQNQSQKGQGLAIAPDLTKMLPGLQSMMTKAQLMLDWVAKIVIPAEAKYAAERIRALEAQVQAALDNHDDQAAREVIYQYGTTGLKAVDAVTFLAKCAYLNSRVNPATLEKWERFAKKYVEGAIKAGETAKAAAAANWISTVSAYPGKIDDLIDESGVLAVEQLSDEKGVDHLAYDVKSALYTMIAPRAGFREKPADDTLALLDRLAKAHNLEVPLDGFEGHVDWTAVEERLAILRQAMLADDVGKKDADTLVKTLLDGFKSLVPRNGGLTTAELNDRLAALHAECLKQVAAKTTAVRIRTLEAQVQAALDGPGDDAARQVVYQFGITGRRAVDSVTFLAKCAFLNSRVNPTTLRKWERFAKENVEASIRAGDFAKAAEAAQRIPPVAAYPAKIDDLIRESGVLAVEQHADEAGTDELTGKAKSALYALIAPRAGIEWTYKENTRALIARLAEIHHLDVPLQGFEENADWTSVEAKLSLLRQSMLDDDVMERDADTIVKTLLGGFKSLVPRNGLTTAELNERLAALRADSLRAVQEAVAKRMAEAAADEHRRLQALWARLVEQLAAAVDLPARETAFAEAVSDRTEPAVNRMLGEGARALRLFRAHGTITPPQATSLLAAAVYMGFDDVENLAMGLGADIDGTNEKDERGRTPFLLALEYGFKGQAASLLAGADRAKRDAQGYGAIHYAVRGNDPLRLSELLLARLDARKAAKDGTTPLMLAAKRDNATMARMLLAPSDLDAKDKAGYTAFLFAAERGNLEIAKMLVSAGADAKAATGAGADAVELAASANAEDLIAYLLEEAGLQVGERPVSWCVIHGKVLPLKTLVAHGGKLIDRHLAAAAKCGHLDMVKYLVGQGCDVNSDDVHAVYKEVLENAKLSNPKFREIADYLYSQGYRD